MNKGSSVMKVKGGKMVRIHAEFDSEIRSAAITGDFFLHPETIIKDLEASLIGMHIPLVKEDISRALGRVLAQNDAMMIGLSPDDIADALMEAVS